MTAVRLEVTYEDGLPSVAYLYLPRNKNERSDRCVEVEPDMVLDVTNDGKLIGIEILSPELVTVEGINAVLEQYGLAPLEEKALRPLFVA